MKDLDKNGLRRRYKGHIKFFQKKSLYGFIVAELSESSFEDIFFHLSEFKPDTLIYKGQQIEFSIEDTDKGKKAINCIMLF